MRLVRSLTWPRPSSIALDGRAEELREAAAHATRHIRLNNERVRVWRRRLCAHVRLAWGGSQRGAQHRVGRRNELLRPCSGLALPQLQLQRAQRLIGVQGVRLPHVRLTLGGSLALRFDERLLCISRLSVPCGAAQQRQRIQRCQALRQRFAWVAAILHPPPPPPPARARPPSKGRPHLAREG